MTTAVAILVFTGLALAVAVGLTEGFDPLALLILSFMALLGVVAIASARIARSGRVAPARCSECDGVISPSSPYCKHCGARR